jgi:hypothetical protein
MDDYTLARMLDMAVGTGSAHAFGRALAEGFKERLDELSAIPVPFDGCKECGHPQHRKACETVLYGAGSATGFCDCTNY